jgi:predicted nuclease of predicted toxin-antitoxin system
VKLLLDENPSRRLVRRIEDLFPETRHVSTEGLMQAPDMAVWAYARQNGFTILSADGDFYNFAVSMGPPPKVIWLKGCDYPTANVEKVVRSQAIRIAEFEKDAEQAVLVLTRVDFCSCIS